MLNLLTLLYSRYCGLSFSSALQNLVVSMKVKRNLYMDLKQFFNTFGYTKCLYQTNIFSFTVKLWLRTLINVGIILSFNHAEFAFWLKLQWWSKVYIRTLIKNRMSWLSWVSSYFYNFDSSLTEWLELILLCHKTHSRIWSFYDFTMGQLKIRPNQLSQKYNTALLIFGYMSLGRFHFN